MADASTMEEADSGSWIRSAVISALILGTAGGVAAVMFFTEPTAEKGGASKETAMLVDVVSAEKGTYRPEIVAQGTVEAAREIVLRPQVGGRVVALGSSFTPGGHVEEGELLVRLEAEDYRHALAQRESELREAKSALAVEKGRHDAAKAEYSRFGEELAPENEALVLRRPQLQSAEERVDAARAAVDQAELNLRRTTVEAPFDAHVVRRDVNVGSQVSPEASLARLVGTDVYWIGVELPLSKIRWVEFPKGESDEGRESEGSPVRVRNRQAWPKGVYRSGHLYKRIGELDAKTRMARVLARIPDPMALEADEETPSLTLGAYVEVRIRGKRLEDVVRLERDYIRSDNTVWTMEDGALRLRDVEILLRDETYAYISEGLSADARVVTTHLSTVEEGAPLRLSGSEEGTSGE